MKKSTSTLSKNSITKKHLLYKFDKKINKNYNNIVKNIILNLDDTKNSFHSLSKNFKFNFTIKELKKFKKFNTIVIIGMGGSILGAQAIYSFLNKKIKKEFYFFDNLDEEKILHIQEKKKLNKILFIVISKSGNTIETLSNFSYLKIAKKNSKNIILISENSNNPLHLLSKKMNLFYIEHKKYIGGRYSVLSEVGMVPASLMGINIIKLRKNLKSHFKLKKQKFLKESSIKLANILLSNKLRTLIFFNYVPELNDFLYWAQQLIAESLGKRNKGFLPIISPAPKDHHSLLQLYLDGPRDKLFYIFSTDKKNKKKTNLNIYGKKFNFLNNKKLDQIKLAQKNAFIKILKNKNIPFREFIIRDFQEDVLGELFSYFILETAIVGKLVNINPFNQPAVEQLKKNTKRILY